MAHNRKLSGGHWGSALAIRVTPRAKRNQIVEVMADDTIKVRLTAPPVEGKANQALVDFLSEVLGVNKSRIEIVGGATSRDKLVTILDLPAAEAQAIILQHIED
jgi:hypothetical protein